MWRLNKYWVGLAFLGVGLALFADNMGWIRNGSGLIWPIVVIIFGASWLIGQLGGNFGWFSVTIAAMVTASGVMQLLSNLGQTEFGFVDVWLQGWPVFILAIGLEMLFGNSGRRRVRRTVVTRSGRSSGSRTYVGRIKREDGNWRVRWEEVNGEAESESDAGAGATDNPAATEDGDAAVEAEWVDSQSGSDAGDSADKAEAQSRTRHQGRHSFSNQTRIAGEVRIGSSPWDLEPDTMFNLGAGEVEIDLSTARIGPGENFLTIRLWAGQVTVYVPPTLPINFSSNLTAGQIYVFGEDHDGLGPSVSYRSEGYDEADRKVNIRVELMFGQVDLKEAR